MTTKTLQERRRFLRGAGVVLGLPLLDGFRLKQAQAAGPAAGYAVFLVDMNGVQQNPGYGPEPERFWPSKAGALTTNASRLLKLGSSDTMRARIWE